MISYTYTYIEMQKIVKQMLIKDIKCIWTCNIFELDWR